VALLRGINVGGNNIIPMKALAACLVKERFDEVRTYIQSGNVLFASRKATAPELEKRMEKAVAATFGCTIAVVVCPAKQMKNVIERAPEKFGSDAAVRYNVLFCKRPMTSRRALALLSPKPGVDEAAAGDGVLYVSTLRSKATRSSLPRIIGTPAYRLLTIRNWNTTLKLAQLMGQTP
jgi:uncharacterized protein (DUF1697 family)